MKIDKEEYRIISREVDETIGNIVDEFNGAVGLFKNDKKFVRMRLLIAFSFAEVICGIFGKFYNLSLGNEDLMKKWFKDYCLNKENEVYEKHKYIKNLDENYFYKLRCSVIHAFTLPEQEGKNAIMFINGSELHSSIDKIDSGFTGLGLKTTIMSTDSIMALFTKGAENLLKEIFIDENNANSDNLNALKRINVEFYRRGAKHIELNKA